MSRDNRKFEDRKDDQAVESATRKRNSRGNGKKGGRNSKSKSRRDFEDKVDKVSSNPQENYNKVEYYIRDKFILEQATQLAFQHFLGTTPIGSYDVPTIERLYMNPCPGVTYTRAMPGLTHPERSGINLAATKLFVKLSMHSGRNMVYAPQDVATMILALSQIFAMHSFVRRLFGSVNVSSYWNRMFPRAIIEAMGIDYDDFVDNYSDYRTRYNALVATVNKVPILFNNGYLQKSATQYDFMFTDDESPLAQIYLYLPESTWIIDETSYAGGTILKTTPVCPHGSTRTFADLLVNVLRPMVNALLQSSTLNLVYADLLRLAQNDKTVTFTTIDPIIDGYAIAPIHSYEALLHIHNAQRMGIPDAPTLGTYVTPFNDVYPDPSINSIIYNPGWTKSNVTTGYVATNIVIDSPEPNPTAETRLEMLRYKSNYSNNAENIGGVDYLDYAILTDYYVTIIDVIRDDPSTTTAITTFAGNTYPWTSATVSAISQFDWHPIVTLFDMSTSEITNVIGDLNFYTEVDVDYLSRLNEVVYLGLFDMDT